MFILIKIVCSILTKYEEILKKNYFAYINNIMICLRIFLTHTTIKC